MGGIGELKAGTWTDVYTPRFMAALFTVVKLWKQSLWSECFCLPKIPIVKANDSSDSVRSWDLEWHLGHEGGAYTNGIHAFIKEALWIHSSLSTMWGHSERYTSWKRALAKKCIKQQLDFGIHSLQVYKKSNFCSLRHPVYGILK